MIFCVDESSGMDRSLTVDEKPATSMPAVYEGSFKVSSSYEYIVGSVDGISDCGVF